MKPLSLGAIPVPALLWLAALFLSACQTPGPAPQPHSIMVTPEDRMLSSRFLQKAALMLHRSGKLDAIEGYYQALQDTDLEAAEFHQRDVLLASVYFENGKIYQALGNLPDLDTISEPAYKAIALNIRSRGVLAIGKPMEAADLSTRIDAFLDNEQAIDDNHRFIWDALNRISDSRIVAELKRGVEPPLRGWLELNLIARRSNMMPAAIEPWLDKWNELFADHAASARFAPNLLADARQLHIRPTHVALLLPLNGKFQAVAEAIQNGILYAYYQQDEASRPVYQNALQRGADFIIGPLRKELVAQLAFRPELEVPTLTLNYADDLDRTIRNLYQFGLKPEDEAEQVADYALQHGLYHAVTLTPDNNVGERLKQAFTQRFESLGGRVVESAHYPASKNDYSNAIKSLLNLSGSEQRHSILTQITGEQSEFIPRRRQDVDMVFMSGNPRQARLIKPQLKFHHAKDLPVYATSGISSSISDPDADRDLDEILFVDTPWALDHGNNQDFQAVRALWPQASERYAKFFAMGLDAYRLIPRLRHLMLNPDQFEDMNTGRITVDQKGQIHRNLLLATYQKGLAQPLMAKPAQQPTLKSQ
jgi:outer membrane PBP1 activator LpoA protein